MKWLLLRGLSREQRHWGSFPDTLATALGADVSCIDAPGFGTECERRSPFSLARITDDMRRRFDTIRGDDDWSVLGISLGGMVALNWCARFPTDFKRAVVVNTSAGNLSLPHDRFRLTGVPSLATSRFRSTEAAERATLAVSVNRTDHDLDELARRYAGWYEERRPHPRSLAAQVTAAMRFAAPSNVPVPLLVLASRGDRLVSYRCGQRIAARLNAPLRLHDTAGHDLALDDPDWICRQIMDWQP